MTDTRTAVVITAYGFPAPQGSKLRTRFGLVDDNAKTLKPWRKAVTAAAIGPAILHGACPLSGPVCVEVTFTLPRPRHHFRTGKFAHTLRMLAPGWPIARGTGDVDKLARACLDSLTDAHVWDDDVQVVELTARKHYPGCGTDALAQPGALIRVWPVTS